MSGVFPNENMQRIPRTPSDVYTYLQELSKEWTTPKRGELRLSNVISLQLRPSLPHQERCYGWGRKLGKEGALALPIT